MDAGPGPIPACTLPPVDVTHCNVDADCTKVMKGCFCGPQPVLGVNNAYASAVQTCEAAEAANCNIRCAQENTYRPSHGAGTVLDPDLIVARCDTTGLVGACVTEIP